MIYKNTPPRWQNVSLVRKGLGFLLSHNSRIVPNDKLFLSLYFRIYTGQKLHRASPITFREKIQWLKLHNCQPECSVMVDKYAVRELVAKKIGSQYLIPSLGVWESFAEIDFSKLPDRFVLKTTHDSGGVWICRDKRTVDFEEARKTLEKRLKHNYFWKGRERPYKNVTPRIVAEKLLVPQAGGDLKDYKIWCFNGRPLLIQVDSNRFSDHHRNFYDTLWRKQNLTILYPQTSKADERPGKLDEMLALATELSEGFPFLRVDFYYVNEKVFFGELTFHPDGGIASILPVEWDKKLGDLIPVP